ncbi:hypothetical protein BGX38DRAFT_1253501 [Terfezia claveryi]|nr:hypothetical protein BGX38DRAFT_1253501 [Terfezia claveryi]
MVKKSRTNIECEVTKPDGTKEKQILPYGALIWATNNAVRPVVNDLMAKISQQASSTAVALALVDCSATKYAPTAQVGCIPCKAIEHGSLESELKSLRVCRCKQQRQETRVKQLSPFEYSHQGSLAYIGMDRAVADITWFNARSRILVIMDWIKVKIFGRDVSRE